jgi:WD40 repeat protein
MKKLLLIILLLNSAGFSQKELLLRYYNYDSFLKFIPQSNDLIVVVQKVYCTKDMDSCKAKYSVIILSNKDGGFLKEVPLPDEAVADINVSHDGKSFIVFLSHQTISGGKKGVFIVKKYSLEEDQWVWEKEWHGQIPGLRATYSKDDKQIICISSGATFFLDSNSGSLIKSKNEISSIIDYNYEFSKFALSENGKYFAFWKRKYLTFSKYDETGLQSLIDLFWYGIRWIFFFGSIPQYVYVWDVDNNKLCSKISIPYETKQGSPAFTYDEKNILIGPIKSKYLVYSTVDKKVIREFLQVDSIQNEFSWWGEGRATKDFKIISPDENSFVNCLNDNDVFIFDYKTGELIHHFKQTTLGSSPLNEYAVAYSPDSKYFAVVTKGNKINLYDTKTWELIWQTEYPSKKE